MAAKKLRWELTIFAQAWRDTLARFPQIVVAEQIRTASQVAWLRQAADQESFEQETALNMTPSQATNIRSGKTDAAGRTLEGLAIALFLHSHSSGDDAFEYYFGRLKELMAQRGADALSNHASPERIEAFKEVLGGQSQSGNTDETSLMMVSSEMIQAISRSLADLPPIRNGKTTHPHSLKGLLEDEFIARGLAPDQNDDRDRFVRAGNAMGMTHLTREAVDVALSGKFVDDMDLSRLRHMIMKDRFTGELWTIEELEAIRSQHPRSIKHSLN